MLGIGRYGPRGGDDAGVGRSSGDRATIAADTRAAHRDGWVDDPERDAWVVLNEVAGVGPVAFARLIGRFGTAQGVLDAAAGAGGMAALGGAMVDEDGGQATLAGATARAIVDAARDPELVLARVRRSGVRVLVLVDAAYPARLRRILLPPPVLYLRGSIASLDRPRAVAIVGTRRPTGVGRGTAGRIADAVASRGATIVSGLAVGVDAAAHVAAVTGGHPTVAVIGGGHDRLYPAAHRELVEQIVDTGGAVVSEFAPDIVPSRGTFPRRNRIISGLSDATIVIEAGARSGALTTAAWALEQGRSLHIVPGRMDDPSVAGSLAFLREAGPEARVVAGIPELLDDLGLLEPVASPRSAGDASGAAVLASLPPVERSLARAVIAGHTSVDELVAATGLGGATVLGALTALELRGLVLETFGRYRPAGDLAVGARQPAHRRRARTRPPQRLGDAA